MTSGIQGLTGAHRGKLIQPGDGDYDSARKAYNAMIDRRPRLIARCVDVADVMTAVNVAREQKLLLAVRGGGLTLGGGIGHLTRGLGLAIDNLLEVDMVLADEPERAPGAGNDTSHFHGLRRTA